MSRATPLLALLLAGATPLVAGGARAQDAPRAGEAPAAFRLPTTSHLIPEIQGRAHRSPLAGQTVTDVPGVVTHTTGTAFLMQCTGDGDPTTSDALQVYVGRGFEPMPEVGDRVVVTGKVVEWGGLDPETNKPRQGVITQTQIERPKRLEVLAKGVPLPPAARLGKDGRMPPLGAVAAPDRAEYDPARFGMDFWESLESMRVELVDAVLTGPSNGGELVVLPGGGAGYPRRTARGGLLIDPECMENPGRALLTGPHARKLAGAAVGDRLARVEGVVVHERTRAYKVFATALEGYVAGDLPRAPTRLVGDAEHLTIGGFNVENFSVKQGRERALEAARGIVEYMRAPAIVALQEVADDDGEGRRGRSEVVSSDETLGLLCEAIRELEGPAYEFVYVAPALDTEGGAPGGNIRVAFLYDPARVGFERRGRAGSLDPNRVEKTPTGARLALNPGRVDPTNPCWESTRRTLAAEFTFQGKPIVVLSSHFSSRRGDDPGFGATQPPVLHSEPQRLQQAAAVHAFVKELAAADPTLTIVALGDYNDFWFRPVLRTLAGEVMTILTTLLPEEERYSYVYQGQSQALDHALLAGPLRADPSRIQLEYVHVCAEYPPGKRISDHDPLVVRLRP